jgi:F0F1-type ATP synthase assembly protein I
MLQTASNDRGGNYFPVQSYGPYLTLGLQLALAVVVFFFVGRWIDGLWNTAPWGSVIGAFVGAFGGLYKFIMTALELAKKQDQQDAAKRK